MFVIIPPRLRRLFLIKKNINNKKFTRISNEK